MKIYRFYMSWHQNVVVQRKHWNAVRKIECSFITYFSALGCAAYRSIELLDDGESMSLVAECFYAAVYDGFIWFSRHHSTTETNIEFQMRLESADSWWVVTAVILVRISKAAVISPYQSTQSHNWLGKRFFSTRRIQSKSRNQWQFIWIWECKVWHLIEVQFFQKWHFWSLT